MFKMYSEEGCLFECRLMNAYNFAGCIPWDYPIPPRVQQDKKSQIKICNSTRLHESDLAKFNDHMNNEMSVRNCHCQPNCEEVTFEAQVSMRYFAYSDERLKIHTSLVSVTIGIREKCHCEQMFAYSDTFW